MGGGSSLSTLQAPHIAELVLGTLLLTHLPADVHCRAARDRAPSTAAGTWVKF